MGRTRRITKERAEAPDTSNSLVASAVRVSGAKDYVKFSRTGQGWQREAWEFYNTIGEYRYACDWVGAMLSKAALHATEEIDGTITPVLTGPAFEYVDQLFGDTDGKAEMLRVIGIHFTVAGECWLFATDNGDQMQWQVAAASEVTQRAGSWYISGQEVISDGEPLAIRLWRPHPQKPMEANSPSRSVLAILGEIAKLTQHVSAQVDSRLAGAGIFAVPSEMTFPQAPAGDGETQPTVDTASGFMAVLQQAMSTAIRDRGDASALVPIVVTAPGEHIDKMRHLTFWSELDRQAVELRNEAIRRLALGMDMPPEVLQGVSDSNHWAAWQADESAIKGHTEPLLKIITSSLAEGYLRPLLADDENFDGEIAHFSIGADTSQLRLRPNRSKEAFELYDRGELDGDALRRETGFEKSDAPDQDEVRYWFLRKVASGSTTPDLVEAALREIGLFADVPSMSRPEAEETQEERPVPSLVEHPTRDLPERSDPALVAACEQIVFRALERAGNRLKNRMGGKIANLSAAEQYLAFTVKPGDVPDLLEDAFGQNVVRVAERHGISPQWLSAGLDDYTRGLLTTQTEFTYEHLAAFLDRVLEEGQAA